MSQDWLFGFEKATRVFSKVRILTGSVMTEESEEIFEPARAASESP